MNHSAGSVLYTGRIQQGLGTYFRTDQLEELRKNMQQITHAPERAELKHPTAVSQEKAQQKITAGQLAMYRGMEFPQAGLPVVMDDGETVAVHAGYLVNSESFFLTDHAGLLREIILLYCRTKGYYLIISHNNQVNEMAIDLENITRKINALESKVSELEKLHMPNILQVDEIRIKEAVRQYLESSNELKGLWKGRLSAVDEIRKMRRHSRGY